MRRLVIQNVMDKKPKPCPFCGQEPVLQRDIRYPRPACQPKAAYEVVCKTLNCLMYRVDDNYWLTPEEAIRAWNTRA